MTSNQTAKVPGGTAPGQRVQFIGDSNTSSPAFHTSLVSKVTPNPTSKPSQSQQPPSMPATGPKPATRVATPSTPSPKATPNPTSKSGQSQQPPSTPATGPNPATRLISPSTPSPKTVSKPAVPCPSPKSNPPTRPVSQSTAGAKPMPKPANTPASLQSPSPAAVPANPPTRVTTPSVRPQTPSASRPPESPTPDKLSNNASTGRVTAQQKVCQFCQAQTDNNGGLTNGQLSFRRYIESRRRPDELFNGGNKRAQTRPTDDKKSNWNVRASPRQKDCPPGQHCPLIPTTGGRSSSSTRDSSRPRTPSSTAGRTSQAETSQLEDIDLLKWKIEHERRVQEVIEGQLDSHKARRQPIGMRR